MLKPVLAWEAVPSNEIAAWHAAGFGFAVNVAVGAGAGLTVTVKLPLALLPDKSLAEHDTVVVPSGNVDPDAGLQVTGLAPSTASLAVAVNVTTAPLILLATVVMFA